jgi:hypothetical protein
MIGDSPKVTLGGYTFRPGEGGDCLFFKPGYPPPPLQGTLGWGYTPFSGKVFTSESTFFVCSILAARPHPPVYPMGGGTPFGWGWGGASLIQSKDGYPR